MTLTAQQARTVVGLTAVDPAGEKAGTVGELFTSDATGEPQWVTLKHGLFGGKENFAPLAGAAVNAAGDLALAVPLAVIRDAPGIDNDGQLTPEEVTRLYAHYGVQPAGAPGTPGVITLQRYIVTEQTQTSQVRKEPI
jgi:hypothetical protein